MLFPPPLCVSCSVDASLAATNAAVDATLAATNDATVATLAATNDTTRATLAATDGLVRMTWTTTHQQKSSLLGTTEKTITRSCQAHVDSKVQTSTDNTRGVSLYIYITAKLGVVRLLSSRYCH